MQLWLFLLHKGIKWGFRARCLNLQLSLPLFEVPKVIAWQQWLIIVKHSFELAGDCWYIYSISSRHGICGFLFVKSSWRIIFDRVILGFFYVRSPSKAKLTAYSAERQVKIRILHWSLYPEHKRMSSFLVLLWATPLGNLPCILFHTFCHTWHPLVGTQMTVSSV